MKIRVHDEVIEITEDTITKTWQWYEQNAIGCICEVLFCGVNVNNTVEYIEWRLKQATSYKNRGPSLWHGFYQMAYFIQTGKSVPLLGA